MAAQYDALFQENRENHKRTKRLRARKTPHSVRDIKQSGNYVDLMSRYCTHLKEEGKSPRTITRYRQTVQFYTLHMSSFWGSQNRLPALSPVHLARFQIYLKTVRGCRDSSIKARMTALASFTRYLVKLGLLKSDPVQVLREVMRRAGRKDVNRTSPDYMQLVQYLRSRKFTPRALRNLLLVELIYKTGLTFSEISRINTSDVLWRRGLPYALVVWVSRKPRLVLLDESFLRRVMELYLTIRNLQTGSRLIKGRSGEDRGYHASSIGRMIKEAWKGAERGSLSGDLPEDAPVVGALLGLEKKRTPLEAA